MRTSFLLVLLRLRTSITESLLWNTFVSQCLRLLHHWCINPRAVSAWHDFSERTRHENLQSCSLESPSWVPNLNSISWVFSQEINSSNGSVAGVSARFACYSQHESSKHTSWLRDESLLRDAVMMRRWRRWNWCDEDNDDRSTDAVIRGLRRE